MGSRSRSWWGWGEEDRALSDTECVEYAGLLPGLPSSPAPVPRISDALLPSPRLAPPKTLADRCSQHPVDRAAHTYGKAYRDVVRALRPDLTPAPDVVAFPRDERDIVDILDWAASSEAAVIPYGAGSSVVGGVEYRGDGHAGVVCLDLSGMNRVLEVDSTNRAARIQAGAVGPELEDQLRPHGYTLRHFPQSFEFSTLGGWLATRSSGHYATLHTHIDDFVQSMRVLTPTGVGQSCRLPASGAGPSPDRLFLGSEGTLGVITEAWMRLQQRPRHRCSASVLFDDTAKAFEVVRRIAQSGLHPANCRLLGPGEALLSGAGDRSVLLLGFESAAVPVDQPFADALEITRSHGGKVRQPESDARDPERSWRSSFLRMPYIRDGLTRMSAIVETFETACTWESVPELCESVTTEIGDAVERICGARGIVNWRLTHAYPDGAAPYFTVIAAGRPGSEVDMWDEVKCAAGEILLRYGATITHHHAVGRDHRPWYDRQRPEPFAAALTAAKHALDPGNILNPGALLG